MARLTGKSSSGRACGKTALLTVVFCLFAAAPAAAAPAWLDPATVSAPGKDAANASVAMDAAGNAIVVWEREHESGGTHDIQMATHAPGGGFSLPTTLSLSATDPVVAMAPDGEAVIAWRHFAAGKYAIQVVTRHPGGSFSAPVTVAETPSNTLPAGIRVAINEAGAVAIAWSQLDPNSELLPVPFFVMASVQPAGGSFSAAKRISPLEPKHAPGPIGETPEEKAARYKVEAEEWSLQRPSASGTQLAIDAAGEAVVLWSYQYGAESIIQASSRPPAGEFSPPEAISEAGLKADQPQMDSDAAGDLFAVWRLQETGTSRVEAAIRPPAGSFSSPQTISATGLLADIPQLAVSSSGIATAVWRLTQLGESTLQAVDIRPDGSLSAVETLPLKKSDHPDSTDIAENASGDLIVAWSATNAAIDLTRASVRRAGGVFSAPADVSDTSIKEFLPSVAIDAGGTGVGVWFRTDGKHNLVEAAGYDAVPPSLREVSIPSSGMVGTAVFFSASPVDDWPIGRASFDFGDGTASTGDIVSHVYAKPGVYQVTAAAEDAAGTVTPSVGTIAILARNDFKIGRFSANRKNGSGRLSVTVPEPGRLVLSGHGVKKATVPVTAAGTVKLPVRPSRKGAKSLAGDGRLSTRLKIAYSPTGGHTSVQHQKVTLVEKHA